MFRVGLGQDVHPFSAEEENKPFMFGGIKIAEKGGLKGNSDSDVILHSICNALSSAVGGDSLSTWADEMCKKGINDSSSYVEYVFDRVRALKYSVENISISVEAKKPVLKMEVINKIKERIALLLKIGKNQVGLTFISGNGLEEYGQGIGIQALTIVNLRKND